MEQGVTRERTECRCTFTMRRVRCRVIISIRPSYDPSHPDTRRMSNSSAIVVVVVVVGALKVESAAPTGEKCGGGGEGRGRPDDRIGRGGRETSISRNGSSSVGRYHRGDSRQTLRLGPDRGKCALACTFSRGRRLRLPLINGRAMSPARATSAAPGPWHGEIDGEIPLLFLIFFPFSSFSFL